MDLGGWFLRPSRVRGSGSEPSSREEAVILHVMGISVPMGYSINVQWRAGQKEGVYGERAE